MHLQQLASLIRGTIITLDLSHQASIAERSPSVIEETTQNCELRRGQINPLPVELHVMLEDVYQQDTRVELPRVAGASQADPPQQGVELREEHLLGEGPEKVSVASGVEALGQGHFLPPLAQHEQGSDGSLPYLPANLLLPAIQRTQVDHHGVRRLRVQVPQSGLPIRGTTRYELLLLVKEPGYVFGPSLI